MLLPLLMLLIAPLPANGSADDKLPESVAVTADTMLYAPSRSTLSATAEGIAGLPEAPVTVTLQCLVDAHFGDAVRCIALSGGARPAATRTEFDKRAAAWVATPVEKVALERARSTRIRPSATTPPDLANPVLIPMIFTETVSARDVVRLGPVDAKMKMEARDIEYDERPDSALLGAYYPQRALDAKIEVRMVATCRVMPDRSLFCHDARPVTPDSRLDAALAREFALATYQVLAAVRLMALTKAGDPVVGREVEMRIGFVAGG